MENISGITILNTEKEDFHTHTTTYSDGFNSVDEMVVHAGKIGMKKIILTDHCQFYLDRLGHDKKTNRSNTKFWENIHNDVEVAFGIEADIVNKEGDISADIHGLGSEHLILSAHYGVYSGPLEDITEAYLNAICRYGDRVMFLGHLCSVYFEKYIDVIPIIDLALEKGVSFELNCANLIKKKTNMPNLRKMFSRISSLYVNSDAHSLGELSNFRQKGFDFLRNKNW